MFGIDILPRSLVQFHVEAMEDCRESEVEFCASQAGGASISNTFGRSFPQLIR